MMRIHSFSTYDRGGGGNAAYRLGVALAKDGIENTLRVRDKTRNVSWVIGPSGRKKHLTSFLNTLPQKILYPRSVQYFSSQFLGEISLAGLPGDLAHLHWIAGGFLSLRQLGRCQLPVVWTLHDMNSFTGGCHYSGSCDAFENHCGGCPALASRRRHDMSFFNFESKKKLAARHPMAVVAPSQWMADAAARSGILRDTPIHVIPYCIDASVFHRREDARARLGLPQNKRIVAFGADQLEDPRKGVDLLTKALNGLPPDDSLQLVCFGRGKVSLSHPVRHFGVISDDNHMADLLSAADVFVVPSREDNLPNAIIEALACGTPCIAFSIGGIPDLIQHGTTGWLVRPFDTGQLAELLIRTDLRQLRGEMSESAVYFAGRRFSEASVARQHIDLYQSVLARFQQQTALP